MHRFRRLARLAGTRFTSLASAVAASAAVAVPAALAAPGPDPGPDPGPGQLTATSPTVDYAPTFTGNGLLGVRVPATGQGYAPGSVPALSELAGFYAQPSGGVQQRASIPTWSTLSFSDGGQAFSLSAGTTTGWRQTLDLRTGVVTTRARWSAPDGHVTDLAYAVLADRALSHIGLVRLTLTPHWSGTASVTDLIDGTPATLSTQTGKGWAAHTDWVSIQAQGTGITVGLASRLGLSADIRPATTEVDQSTPQSVGQQLTFPVRAGRTYVIAKYVGVESSQDAVDPRAAAQHQAAGADRSGFARLLRANDAAWAKLWAGRIDVLGDPGLAAAVSASEFYLWSSIRPGIAWSISPAGLSSNGYNGHIFWDAETWMFPALVAQHPDLAAGIDAYRYARLRAAEQHAATTGYAGARFPWESALDGTEQIPPPSFVNSEGIYEQHITADVALAQWQYFLATGDRRWLATRGWPVLSKAAAFWASRATLGSDGAYHIDGVTGPDEDNPDVNDEVYTNVAAAGTLQDAINAARVLRVSVPASWASIAARLVVPTDSRQGIHPEFSGYLGQQVKQADVTLLQYPWGDPMPAGIAQGDLDYYVPRTDPGGPSMTDAISSIDSAALGSPGCASYVYTERSYEPFIRDVFDQFSETRSGGAFTFTTGIGGFLQEFLYGYSGLRLGSTTVSLAPSLTGQLGGIVLRDLAWHGRLFTVAIGPRTSTVTLQRGSAMRIGTPAGARRLTRRHALILATRRPDLIATSDTVRCGAATASSSQPGAPPLAAVDGSPATDWAPVSLPATLTVPVAGGAGATISHATLQWGQEWIPAFLPNAGGPPVPVLTLRAADYAIQVSIDGRTWRTVATVTGRVTGTEDTVTFAPTRAVYVRVQITGAAGDQLPLLDELAVPRG
jgi:trehalose/maltose hydrolase-like predicted phosphorylase